MSNVNTLTIRIEDSPANKPAGANNQPGGSPAAQQIPNATPSPVRQATPSPAVPRATPSHYVPSGKKDAVVGDEEKGDGPSLSQQMSAWGSISPRLGRMAQMMGQVERMQQLYMAKATPTETARATASQPAKATASQPATAVMAQPKGGSMPQQSSAAGQTAEAGAGEAAAGGGGSMAAAAGPAAAIVMIAQEIEKKAGEAVDAIGNVALKAGETVGELGSGENAKAMGNVVKGVNDMARAVPFVGPVVAKFNDQVIKATTAFTMVTESFTARGAELSGYNSSLATSYAMSGVKELLGDIREADVLGPGLAKMNDAQANISNTLREILLPIKRIIVDLLGGVLQRLDSFLQNHQNDIVEAVFKAEELAKFVVQTLTLQASDAIKTLHDMPENVRKKLDEWEKQKNAEGIILDNFMEALENLPGPFGRVPAREPDWVRLATDNLGVPLLQR